MSFTETPVHPTVRALLAVIVIVQFVVVITLCLRYRLRWVARMSYGWDDWLAVISGIFGTGMVICLGLFSTSGIGYQSTTYPENLPRISQLIFAYELIYHLTIGTAKASALCFYLRVFSNHYIFRWVIGAIILICVQSIAIILWSLLICQPISRFWTENDGDFCGNRRPMYMVASILAIVTDMIIIGLPVPVILGLKIKRSKKKAIIGLFSTAVLMTIVSVVRIISISWIDEANVTATAGYFMFFSALEPCVATLCICLPMLSPLFNQCFGKRTGSTPASQQPPTSGGPTGNTRIRAMPGFSKLEEGKQLEFEMYSQSKSSQRGITTSGARATSVTVIEEGSKAYDTSGGNSESHRSSIQSELVVHKVDT